MNFKILIDTERCKGCEYCIAACMQAVLAISKTLNHKGNHVAEILQPEACVGCRRCTAMCPDMAIRIKQLNPRSRTIRTREKK